VPDPITLPNVNLGPNKWLVIESDPATTTCPAAGTRTSPAAAAEGRQAVVQFSWSTPTTALFSTADDAHHYLWRCFAVKYTGSGTGQYGSPSGIFDVHNGTPPHMPRFFVFDRMYIAAEDTKEVRRGILLNCDHCAVVDSSIRGMKQHDNGDTQAIATFRSNGPLRIENNDLFAAGENILFGGAPSGTPGMVPSDVVIRRNYFRKDEAWRGKYQKKNSLEFKNGQRVLIEGNVFENDWVGVGGQNYALVFTARSSGRDSWARCEDYTFRNNWLRGAAGGVTIGGVSSERAHACHRLLFSNNLFEDINEARWGGSAGQNGIALNLSRANPNEDEKISDVIFENNTVLTSQRLVFFTHSGAITPLEKTRGFVFRYNVALGGTHDDGGIVGQDCSYEGDATISNCTDKDRVITQSVLQGRPAGRYGQSIKGKYFPSKVGDIRWVQATGTTCRDCRLCTGVGQPEASCTSASPYAKGQPFECKGKDCGASMGAPDSGTPDTLYGETCGTRTGNWKCHKGKSP